MKKIEYVQKGKVIHYCVNWDDNCASSKKEYSIVSRPRKECKFCIQRKANERNRAKKIKKQEDKTNEILREFEIQENRKDFKSTPVRLGKIFSEEEQERQRLRLDRKEAKSQDKKKKAAKPSKIYSKKLTEKTPLKYWETKLDDAIRHYTKARDFFFNDTFQCISCEEIKTIDQSENGHYYRRGKLSVRWDLINNNRQCTVCNRIKEGNEKMYRIGLIKKFGLKEIELLDIRSNQIVKYSVPELEEMYNQICVETKLLNRKNKVA